MNVDQVSPLGKPWRLFLGGCRAYSVDIIRSNKIIIMPQVNIPSPFGGREFNGSSEKGDKRLVTASSRPSERGKYGGKIHPTVSN
jgi:hypothetical protein